MSLLLLSLLIALAYLMGSLSSAIIVCHLAKLPDPRLQGSGNPGTTNVLRIAGKKWAVIVLMGDMLKGIIPVLMVKAYFPIIIWPWIGLAAILGHFYPLFFQFKGGKGVATTAGVLLSLAWPLGLMVISSWLSICLLTRYSSLAAIVAALVTPILSHYFTPHLPIMPLLIISVLILWRHCSNIQRLIQGTESRIGRSSRK